MYNSTETESGLEFDFHLPCEKDDVENCQGLKAVDFIVEGDDCLYFIEVKNYEHPKAPIKNRDRDYKMLTDEYAAFPLEIGMKIKDSLLRRYAQAQSFSKMIVFLLIIKFPSSKFKYNERRNLYERISGYIPTGLNDSKYSAFNSISFDIVLIDELKSKYGFDVKELL
jgi:hypothetical protein